jgi:hypothetical protein
MRELIWSVIAIVIGSSAVFDEGVIKPTFFTSLRLFNGVVWFPISVPSTG